MEFRDEKDKGIELYVTALKWWQADKIILFYQQTNNSFKERDW